MVAFFNSLNKSLNSSLEVLHLDNLQIDGALSAELMHNCLTVIGQHLTDIRLERMFTKKKVVDMICQFGDLINAERV